MKKITKSEKTEKSSINISKKNDMISIKHEWNVTNEKYIDEIAESFLHFFYKKMQIRNSNKKIYIIENNVESHQKIAQILKSYREINDILIVKWFSNSFYLHSIENIWNFCKKRLQFTWKKIRKFSKNNKSKIHQTIHV